MRAVDADAILYTHQLEQKAIGKDWDVDDLATAIMTAPTIQAIPVEWLREFCTDDISDDQLETIEWMMGIWQREQEARK